MTKTIKKIITKYTDGRVVESTIGGVLMEELNSGWKLLDTKRLERKPELNEISSIEEYIYLLENSKGMIFG